MTNVSEERKSHIDDSFFYVYPPRVVFDKGKKIPCGALDSRLRGNDEYVSGGRYAGMTNVSEERKSHIDDSFFAKKNPPRLNPWGRRVS